jgi:predicted phage terminase large subunit-like protein
LDHIAKPFSFSDTKAAIKRFALTYKPSAVLIEDKANGSAIIQELRNVITGVIAINPKESKLARAESIADKVNAGNVKIPRFASWADEWLAELAAFPNGKHDDRVDSMGQYINYQTKQMSGGFC